MGYDFVDAECFRLLAFDGLGLFVAGNSFCAEDLGYASLLTGRACDFTIETLEDSSLITFPYKFYYPLLITSQVPANPRYRDLPAENVPRNSGQEILPENAGRQVRELALRFIRSKVVFYLQDDMGQISPVQDEDLHQHSAKDFQVSSDF